MDTANRAPIDTCVCGEPLYRYEQRSEHPAFPNGVRVTPLVECRNPCCARFMVTLPPDEWHMANWDTYREVQRAT